MAATDGPVEEEIRKIVTSGEDTTHGWSDRQIVEEASRRAGVDPGGTIPAAADGEAMGRWGTVIGEIRSETDNDGQTRP